MGSGRNTTPLFEILRTTSTRPAPRSPGVDAPGPERDEKPARPIMVSGEIDDTTAARRVSIPVSTVWAAGVFVVVLAAVAWLVGFQMGRATASDMAGNPVPGVAMPTDGSRGPATNAGDSVVSRSETADTSDQRPAPSPPPSESRTAPRSYLTAEGPITTDPREAGNNYLELALLPEPAAREALAALAAGGVNAVAVPVDPGGSVDSGRSRRNTSPRFRLIGLDVPIPSDRYRRSADERSAYERRVREIGRRWAETGGASDFASTNWAKYDGD